jgi:outer membrane protein assembly factor BamA
VTAFLFCLLVCDQPSAVAVAAQVLAQIRVQGNVATPDEEVVRLAEVSVGMPVGPDMAAQVADRLRATKRFQHVEVLTRYASINDPTQVILVVLVDEGPVSIESTSDPTHPTRVVRKRSTQLQVLPVFGSQDGYGVTYGARLSQSGLLGPNSRLQVPATWGGDKRVAAELEVRFDDAPVSRVAGGVGWRRQTNPFYDADDERDAAWVRAEKQILEPLRVAVSGGWQRVLFLGQTDHVVQGGVDAVFDTRLDPWLPGNAIYVNAGWDRLAFHSTAAVDRLQLDARGYIGIFSKPVLVVRAVRDASDGPLPPYLKPLLGGMPNLRGYAVGTAAGDDLLSGSIELRVPIASLLRVGRIGASGFLDSGTAYDQNAQLADQRFRSGAGGSLWIFVPLARLEVAVARGFESSTRVHVNASVLF